jgi:replicative DNA helicase
MATDVTLSRQPPHSHEAEEALLGSILLNNRVLIDIATLVSQEDFYRSGNRIIYEHMARMWENGDPIDILTLQESLKSEQVLDRVGGPVYLDQLFDRVPSSQNAPYYAKIVHEKALLRKVADLGRELVGLAEGTSESTENVMDTVGQKFIDLAMRETVRTNRTMSDVMQSLLDTLEKRKVEKGYAGLRTGYSGLDNILGGLQKSDFLILAARPSVGKTALALNIVQNAAEEGKRIAFFSIEMAAEQLALRLLSTISDVSSHKIRRGDISEFDWENKITPALDRMDRMKVFINDNASITPLGIRAEARKLALDPAGGIDLIVIDYLQLISVGKRVESRVQEVSEISRSMKSLARELNIPVLALSQLSRESEKQTRIPRLSDLRESGALEQDADVVMFLHRDDKTEELSLDEKLDVQLIIAKHRNGPTGLIKLKFDRRRTWFKEETTEVEAVFDDEGYPDDSLGELD